MNDNGCDKGTCSSTDGETGIVTPPDDPALRIGRSGSSVPRGRSMTRRRNSQPGLQGAAWRMSAGQPSVSQVSVPPAHESRPVPNMIAEPTDPNSSSPKWAGGYAGPFFGLAHGRRRMGDVSVGEKAILTPSDPIYATKPCTGVLKDFEGRQAESPCFPYVGSCGGAPCLEDIDCLRPGAAALDDAAKAIGFGELGIFSGFSSLEKDFLTEAFALVQQVSELSAWACCLVFGEEDGICDCLSDFVNDVGKDIDFVHGGSQDCDGGEGNPDDLAGARFGRNNIHVCPLFWERYLPLYTSGDPACRDAAVREAAGVLLHELVHICGDTPHPDDQAACDPAYDFSDLVGSALSGACGGIPFDCSFPDLYPLAWPELKADLSVPPPGWS
jgi:hypothetical protein